MDAVCMNKSIKMSSDESMHAFLVLFLSKSNLLIVYQFTHIILHTHAQKNEQTRRIDDCFVLFSAMLLIHSMEYKPNIVASAYTHYGRDKKQAAWVIGDSEWGKKNGNDTEGKSKRWEAKKNGRRRKRSKNNRKTNTKKKQQRNYSEQKLLTKVENNFINQKSTQEMRQNNELLLKSKC